ncbi:MAG: hypothetical protein AB7E79_16170 [Rhodospirillaceae bacterium]
MLHVLDGTGDLRRLNGERLSYDVRQRCESGCACISARSSSVNIPNLFQDPGLRVDFVYRQTFQVAGHEFTGSFEARNLNGVKANEYQESNGRRFNTNTYQLGTSFSLGLTAKF